MADMMLTGRVYDAEEGLRIGLSQYLVEAGKGFEKAFELANEIAGNAPLSNFAVMHALPRIADMGQDEGLFTESLMAAIAQGDDAAKGRMRAFLDGKGGQGGEVMSAAPRRLAPRCRAYRECRSAARSARFTPRADGTTLVVSEEALGPYPPRLTDRLLHWAAVAPERTLVAKRDTTAATGAASATPRRCTARARSRRR